jgi:DNA-binding NarL/FixJ family response regulator
MRTGAGEARTRRLRPRAQTGEARFEALYDLFARLCACGSLNAALAEVLNASIEVVGADGGYIRVFEPGDIPPESNPYPFVVQRGFSEAYINYFSALAQPVDRNARRAVFNGQRVIIEDMTTHPAFLAHREVVLAEGYRSMQATPFMSGNGSVHTGGVVTCFLDVYTPPSEDLETLDLYAEIAASVVVQHRQVNELAQRDAKLIEVLEQQREALLQIREHVQAIEQRAPSLEPDEIRRRARVLSHEIDLTRANLHVPDTNDEESGQLVPDSERNPYGLSSRELAVLVQVWRGLSDKQIALELEISRFTVAKHLGTAMRKLNVESRTQASVIVEREALYRTFAEE